MNKIFRVIWNHATQSWVAVSELTKAKGKTKSKTEKKISVFALSLMTAGATMIGGSALGANVDDTSFYVQIGNQASVTGSENPLEGVAIGRQASAKDRGVSVGRGTSSGAGSVAVGCNTNAKGAHAVAVGREANANSDYAVAVGPGAKALTTSAIALGQNANASGTRGIAIGPGAKATNEDAVAFGRGTEATGRHSFAFGTADGSDSNRSNLAIASGEAAYALGVAAKALNQQSVALGFRSTATGEFSYAMGSASRSESTSSLAIGYNTRVVGGTDREGTRDNSANEGSKFSTAVGGESADVLNSTHASIFGSFSEAKNSSYATSIGVLSIITDSEKASALGANSTVTESERSTALGFFSKITNAPRSIAAGSGTNISNATEGTVIGARSEITAGDKGIAVGVDNTITGTRSGAVGTNNKVSGNDSYVMGNNVTLGTSGSVVLGNNSAQSSANKVTSGTVNGVTYDGFVGAPLSTGSYVSVGSSATDSRQIKYVAAGEISATSTDAINGSQLHSVLTNGKWKVGNNTGAVVNNVAFGDQVNFIGANGTTVTTTANGNVTNVTISSPLYVAGDNITLTNNTNGTVTISSTGGSSGTSPENYFHVNDGKNSSDGNANTNKGAVDAKGGATGGNALAAGIQAKASGLNSVAIGINSNATMSSALAVGTQAKALGDRSSAFGILANASGGSSLALSDNSTASGDQSIAIGKNSLSNGTSTVALGSETKALSCSTVAIGDQAKATDKFATAIGHYTNATAENAIAMGYETFATGKSSIALGNNSNATAAGSVALGNASNATANGSIALGNNTRVTVENGVALGSSSLADRAKFKATAATNTSSYASNTVYALSSASDADKAAIVATATNTLGAVSVGNGTHTRQIINVAAGSNDSDAVNVAQLKAVANKIPSYVAGTNIQFSEPDENGDITISATGGSYRWNLQANGISGNRVINNNNTVLFENGTGTTVVGSAGNTSKLRYNVNRETITVNDSTGAVTSPTSGSNIAFATAREVANAIATSGFKLDVNTFDAERDNVNKSGNAIINPGDVVNVTAAGLSTIEYMESANGGGFRIITNKAKIHANNNGTAGLETDEDGNTVGEGNAVTAGDVVNVINNSGWNTNASGNLATGTSARNTLINPGEAVNFAAGEGLTVEQIRSGNNITYRFNSTVSISNTNSSVNNNGSVSVGNGTQYLNATEVAKLVNESFHTVNSTNTGEEVTATNGTTQVNAGDTLEFVAGKNLVVNQTGGRIAFATAENVTFNHVNTTTLTIGNVSDSMAPRTDISSTDKGLDVGGDKITNVTSALNTTTIPTTSDSNTGDNSNTFIDLTDGPDDSAVVTVKDLQRYGWVVSAEGNSYSAAVRNADTVNFIGEGGINVTGKANATTGIYDITVKAKEVNYTNNGNNVPGTDSSNNSTNATAGNVDNINYGNGNGTTANVTYNNGTLNVAFDVNTTNGTVNDNGTVRVTDGGSFLNATEVAKLVNGASFNATIGTDDTEFENQAGKGNYKVKAGDTITFNAGKNLRVKQENGTFTYALADNINLTGNGSITIGNTTINNGTITNLTHNLPNTNNDDEYKVGDTITTNQILPSGLNITNGATVGDILNSGWNLQGNGKAKDFVKPYDTVNFINGTATEAVVNTTANGTLSNITFNVKVDNSTIRVDDNGNLVANASNIVHGDNVTTIVNNGTVEVITGNSNVNTTTGVAQANSTTTYTDADGNPVTKNDDGTYSKADGSPIDKADVTEKTTTDANKVATVGDIVNTINNVFHTVNSTNTGEEVKENNGTTQVNAGDTLEFVAGKNLVVNQTGDRIAFGLSQNITVNNITANNITVGNTTITNGTISGLNDHLTAPIDAQSNVTNATQTAPVNLTDDQKKEAATVNDVLNAGWNLKANGDAVDAVTHGNNVDFTSNDGSVTINATTDGSTSKLDFKVNAKAVINQVTGNISANGTGQAVANTTNGTVATVTDVANTINQSGWITNGKDAQGKDVSTIVNPGDTVNYVNGNGTTANVTITKGENGQPDTVNVSYDVKAADDTITVDNNGVKVNTGDSKVENGKAASNTTNDVNKVATVGDIVNTINNVYHTVNSTNTGEDVTATNGTTQVNAGDTLEFVAGKNLVVNQTGDRIAFGLSQNITVNNITANGSITVGDTTITNGTVSNLTNNLAPTNNVATNSNQNVANATAPTTVNGTNAATVNDVLNAGWNLQENGQARDFVAAYDTVNFANGSGTTVTVTTTNGSTSTIKVDIATDGNTITIDPNGKISANTTDIVTNPNGTVSIPSTGNGGNLVNGTTVVNAINSASHTIKSGNSGEQVVKNEASAKVKPGKTVTYNAGKNLVASITDDANGDSTVNYGLATDISVNSVQVGGNTGPVITGDTNGNVWIGKPDANGNLAPTQIKNVAPGTDPTDAVNVSQLKGVANNINNRINKVGKEARGGIAGANAAASLPQVYLPGKSMVAASAGTFKGENALAVGYSRASDNGKLILKLQGNANSQGDVGAGVGIGYQW